MATNLHSGAAMQLGYSCSVYHLSTILWLFQFPNSQKKKNQNITDNQKLKTLTSNKLDKKGIYSRTIINALILEQCEVHHLFLRVPPPLQCMLNIPEWWLAVHKH